MQLYRETDKRSGNRSKTDQDPADQESTSSGKKGKPNASQALTHGLDKHRERLLLGSLTNSHKFKVDGMIKKVWHDCGQLVKTCADYYKTFSLTIAGVSQHLISYYRVEDVENGRLRSPSSLPELATLEISPEYLDKTHFRQPPRVEYGPDGVPRYRGEADDPDLETIVRAADKSSRRFEPYGATSPRRTKKPKSQRTASQSDADTAQYPADAYNYPQYPGYPYGAAGYPYMQYPVASPTDGTPPDPATYPPYMGGYYWPGYPPTGPPIVDGPSEEDDDDDDGEDKAEADEEATSATA